MRTIPLLAIALSCAVSASAQIERYELGHRFRHLEAVAAEVADPDSRRAIQEPLDAALASFFDLRFDRACQAIDRARFTLAGDVTPEHRWASSLVLNFPAQLVDTDQARLEWSLDALYDPGAERPDDVRLRLRVAGREPRTVPIPELPGTGSIDLAGLGAGDHSVEWCVLVGAHEGPRRVRVVSVVDDLKGRLDRARARVRALDDRSTERATASMLRNRCLALSRKRTQETDFPAARLLADCEAALDAAEAGAQRYTSSLTGEYWLRLRAADGSFTCRVSIPPKSDDPPALVLALHGAGGSENLFFDGENGLTPALCRERGWILVAPRSKLTTSFDLEGFLDAFGERYEFDADRVFLIGHSMGAMQGMRAACASPTRVRAVAALGGGGEGDPKPGLDAVRFYFGIGGHDFLADGARRSRRFVESRGASVTWREFEEVGHVLILQDALREVFGFFDES